MESLIEVLNLSEHILAWGLMILIGIINIIIYLLFSFSTKPSIKNHLIYELRYVFLTKGLFSFILSTMPILMYMKAYEIKRIFEFAGTITLLILAPQIILFLRKLINFIK